MLTPQIFEGSFYIFPDHSTLQLNLFNSLNHSWQNIVLSIFIYYGLYNYFFSPYIMNPPIAPSQKKKSGASAFLTKSQTPENTVQCTHYNWDIIF